MGTFSTSVWFVGDSQNRSSLTSFLKLIISIAVQAPLNCLRLSVMSIRGDALIANSLVFFNSVGRSSRRLGVQFSHATVFSPLDPRLAGSI